MKKKFNTWDNKSFYIIIYLILLYIILLLVVPYITGIPFDSSFYNYCSIFLAVIAIAISVKTQANQDIIKSKNNRAKRKVKILKSLNPDNIEREIEKLYDDILLDKSIDKIEIINTTVGHLNDNRKDVIIIYH